MNKPESEMVLVPREPTEAMLDAVQTKPHPTRPDGWSDRHAHLYREMVAAFPEGAEAAQLLGEIEQEFVVLKDLPAFIRRMQDEIRAARAAAHPSNQVLQEPVAWMKAHSCGIGTFTDNPAAAQAWAVLGSPLTPLYASPQAVPSEQPIAEQPTSDKANLMVAVGSDLPPAPPEGTRAQWLKEAALQINSLILAASAMGSQPRGLPVGERITDADIDRLEAKLLAHIASERAARDLGSAGPSDDLQAALPNAARDVLAERARQQSVEGWTPEHDDEHSDGSMAIAAACYAYPNPHNLAHDWPWAPEWWKPKDRRRNLVRAGALILAEIERLDRARVEPVVGPLSSARSDLPSTTPPAASLPVSAPAGQEDARDAKRYRWLKQHNICACPSLWGRGVGFPVPLFDGTGGRYIDGQELDAAIDAAMSATTKEN